MQAKPSTNGLPTYVRRGAGPAASAAVATSRSLFRETQKTTVGSQASRSEGAVHVTWPSVRSSPACSVSVSDKSQGAGGSGWQRRDEEATGDVLCPSLSLHMTLQTR